MVSTEPVVTLHLCIRTFFLIHPVIQVGFIQWIVSFQYGIIGDHLLRSAPAVRIIPGFLVRVHVILYVFDVTPACQHQHLEPLFSKLLGGPAATDTRTNYNGVVGLVRHDSLFYGWFIEWFLVSCFWSVVLEFVISFSYQKSTKRRSKPRTKD